MENGCSSPLLLAFLDPITSRKSQFGGKVVAREPAQGSVPEIGADDRQSAVAYADHYPALLAAVVSTGPVGGAT